MCLIKTNSFRAKNFPETKKFNLISTSIYPIDINDRFFIAVKRCTQHLRFCLLG